jgi:hypothetical protein
MDVKKWKLCILIFKLVKAHVWLWLALHLAAFYALHIYSLTNFLAHKKMVNIIKTEFFVYQYITFSDSDAVAHVYWISYFFWDFQLIGYTFTEYFGDC